MMRNMTSRVNIFPTLLSLSVRRTYATTSFDPLKVKLPVFRTGGEVEGEHVTVGKLRESEHSVAKIKLEFIKLDDVLQMSPEEVAMVVVVPKRDKSSTEQRIEKLEAEVDRLHKLLAAKK
eukprot:TRINITY_DN3604_c0_g1_i1.p1 TRINITY_DN3604_c0_g1~~TRINITY_DN3604_c0_g1_i1.p1  ORF type:complete len:120 (-),score=36.67 TRINITY_DN3604_c0_g1_i1:159-518(-)